MGTTAIPSIPRNRSSESSALDMVDFPDPGTPAKDIMIRCCVLNGHFAWSVVIRSHRVVVVSAIAVAVVVSSIFGDGDGDCDGVS